MSKTKQNLERSKSAEKSATILKGAMKEFLKHGYAGTSMDQIAKVAAVSKATVYSHFGDKESLFNAVIEDLVQEKFQTVMSLDRPESFGQDPKQVLSEMVTKMLENTLSDRNFHNFIRIIIGESGRFPELAKAYVNNLAKPGIEALTNYLKSHPELKLEDPEATVRIIVGSLVYFVMLQEMLHGKDIMPLESDRLTNTLIDLITRNQD